MYKSSSENNVILITYLKLNIYMFNKLYTHNYTFIFYYKTCVMKIFRATLALGCQVILHG